MAKQVQWICVKCSKPNLITSATTKRSVMCPNSKCEALYAITGIRPDGTPMLTYRALTSKLDKR